MLRRFLFPENIARAGGVGPEVDLGADRAKLLVITLGINHVMEQQALGLSIWGSPDKTQWGTRPLATFPSKYYCGMYSQLLNLAKHPDIRFIRVEWKMSRWAKGDTTPLFGFYVFAEESGSRVSVARASAAVSAAAVA